MTLYVTLAALTLGLHLAFILWVLFGWLLTATRRWLRVLHIVSVVYGAFIMTSDYPCPLTLLENFFLRRAGRPAYDEFFLIHYLEAAVYPDIPPVLLSASAAAVCAAILGVYALRYLHRAHPLR